MFHLRPATPADIPALLVLERSEPSAAHWNELAYQQLFSEETGRVTIVIEDDYVRGFLVAHAVGAEWEIENLVIAYKQQRQGLGSRLVQEILDRAQTQGTQAVFLDVRESNQAARGLYSRLGFAESGRRKSYYGSPEEDALLYKKLFHEVFIKRVEAPQGL